MSRQDGCIFTLAFAGVAAYDESCLPGKLYTMNEERVGQRHHPYPAAPSWCALGCLLVWPQPANGRVGADLGGVTALRWHCRYGSVALLECRGGSRVLCWLCLYDVGDGEVVNMVACQDKP